MTTQFLGIQAEFERIFALTKKDPKPLYGIMNHLTSEVGELAEQVEIHEGHSKKTPKEPLVGEVVDVIQCALSVFARAYAGRSDEELLDLLEEHFVLKNNKWEASQPVVAQPIPSEKPVSVEFPETSVHRRIFATIGEQLGLYDYQVRYNGKIIAEYGADSLDIVELIMALEDEFGIESDDDDVEAANIETVRDVCLYVESLLHKQKQGIPLYKPEVAKQVTETGRKTLAQVMGSAGLLLTHVLSKSDLEAVAQQVVAGAPQTGRVYVQIRKHPDGHSQPLGKRKVARMELQDGLGLKVGIGDGKQGWVLNLADPTPSFLTFRLGLEGGPKATVQQAYEYWKRHNP